MLWAVVLVLGVVASPSVAQERQHAAGTPSLRLAAWNIEWLGKPADRSGRGKNVAQKVEDLSDYISKAAPDVLGLIEIIPTAGVKPPRSKELDAVFEAMNKQAGQEWEYVLYPGRGAKDQLTGVAWNRAKVNAVNAKGEKWDAKRDSPWRVPLPQGKTEQGSVLWHRPPHAMKFSAGEGKTDFVVIVLHMKADYQGDFSRHRGEEAKVLAGALDVVRKHWADEDVVLLGDTNCVEAREFLTDAFERAGLTDLNEGRLRTQWRGGTMSRVFVPRKQPEFARSVMGVASDGYLEERNWRHEDFKQHLSDHYLVYASIDVMEDDD
jgi:endonuclease/exonuclease/phosphatase family metal-dependent hydrolase